MNIIAQVISICALIFFALSVQMKEKKKLLLFQLVANLLYGISYILLDVKIAFYMNLISCLRCIILYFSKKDKPSVMFFLLILGLILYAGIYNYEDLLSLIPIVITIIYTVSTWQNNMKVIRYGFISAGVVWIFYNFIVGAYASIISNLFEIISGIIALNRNKNKERKV